MFTIADSIFIGLCLNGFFFGLYSGIFALYLQGPSKESRTAMIVFYILCVLYVLSTATFVCGFLSHILAVYPAFGGTLPPQLLSMYNRLFFVQPALFCCCDVIAQFILIYRCWIVWGKNIRVVIIPSFLAIVFLATWLASEGALIGAGYTLPWGDMMTLTGLAASMAVNALVTGLIVFKILKVFLEVKSTSVERTLGSLSSNTGGTKLRHIIFIIIESGMALFAIQLVRVVIASLISVHWQADPTNIFIAYDLIVGIHEMLNGIAPTLIYVRAAMGLSFDDEDSFVDAAGSLVFNNPPSDPNPLELQGMELESSSSNMAPQERNEDISFTNNSPSDPDSLRLVGSCSNTPHQEESEIIEVERY